MDSQDEEEDIRQRFALIVSGLQFTERLPRRTSAATFTVRIDVNDAAPPIWRRLELRSDLSLESVHRSIQAAFGWWDYHLYRFALGGDPFAPGSESFACPEELAVDDDGSVPTTDVRLDEVLGAVGDQLHYVYDFGDNWDLTIEVETVVEPANDVAARCIDGARAAPPEDCGGVRDEAGLAKLLNDPGAFDLGEVNERLVNPLFGLVEWGLRPEVVDFITRFRGSPLGDALVADAMAATGPPHTSPEERAAALAPVLTYLDHLGDGLTMTSAGYIKPADLAVVAAAIPTVQGSIFPVTRESECPNALFFRQALQRVGLIRASKGTLRLTKAGARLVTDPDKLWSHLAGRLFIEDRDAFTQMARIAMLLASASGASNPSDVAAGWLTHLGWSHGERREPIRGRDLFEPNRVVTAILHNLATEPVTDGYRNAPSPAAIDMARAALQG